MIELPKKITSVYWISSAKRSIRMQNLPIRESGVFCSGSSVNTRCASHRGTNVVFTSVHVTRAVWKQGTLEGHFNLQRYITCAPSNHKLVLQYISGVL